MSAVQCLLISSVGDPADAIFETWFATMNLKISREDAKIIFDAGVGVGKCVNIIMPRTDSRLRVYVQPVIKQAEKLLLTA